MIKCSRKTNVKKIGILLLAAYIVLDFVCNDLFLSTSIKQIAMYMLLGYGMFTIAFSLKNRSFNLKNYVIWYFVFLCVSFFTMFYSLEFSFSSGGFYHIFVSFVLLLSFSMFMNNENDFNLICNAYVLAAVAIVSMLLLSGKLRGTYTNRLGSELFGNANSFAELIMYAQMYVLWLLVYGGLKKRRRVFLSVALIGNFYALILSAGRKFLIIPLIFLYVLLIFKVDRRGRRRVVKYTIYIGIIVIAIYVAIMRVPVFYNAIGFRMELWLNGIKGVGIIDNSSRIRNDMRELAIKEFFSSPFWGHGFDMFKYLCRDRLGAFVYSHCNYTELLYNGGIVYFLTYYWFIFKLATKEYGNGKRQSRYKAFIVAVIICELIFDYACVTMSNIHTLFFLAMADLAMNTQMHCEEKELIDEQN